MEPIRPAWPVWAAWAMALVGGLAVLVAAVVALTNACATGGSSALGTEACAEGVPLTLVQILTTGGTTLAVTGAAVATYLTVRHLSRRSD